MKNAYDTFSISSMKVIEVIFSFLAVVICVSSLAQESGPLEKGDPNTLATFLEKELAVVVREGHAAGAVFAVASSGENGVDVSTGALGAKDLRTREPVQTDETLFSIASITKLFTALAAFQLIDEGKLTLDDNVNDHLVGFQVREPYDVPLTIGHLLSHRAGLDSELTLTADPIGQPRAIPDAAKARTYRPISAPGDFYSYDNFAFGLMGEIIASIEGKPFADVLDEKIFAPLGMNRTSVGVPENRIASASGCYVLGAPEGLISCDAIQLTAPLGGAGGIWSTADDMGLFVAALLEQTDGDEPIVSHQSFVRMIDMERGRPVGGVGSVGYGFIEYGAPGGGVFGHSGGLKGFSSSLAVHPDSNVAYFAVISSSDAFEWGQNLVSLLGTATKYNYDGDFSPGGYTILELPVKISEHLGEDHLFNTSWGDLGGGKALPTPEDLVDLEGRYYRRHVASNGTLALAPRLIMPLFENPIVVKATGDSSVVINDVLYTQVAPWRFEASTNDVSPFLKRVAFHRMPGGWQLGPHVIYFSTKLPALHRPALGLYPFVAGLVVWLLIGGVVAIVRREFSSWILLGGFVAFASALFAELQWATVVARTSPTIVPIIVWRLGFIVGLVALGAGTIASWQRVRAHGVSTVRVASCGVQAGLLVLMAAFCAYYGILWS
ncbi:MAG: serine hydrolase domain-containing protein [Pseudomonadota bacterium]